MACKVAGERESLLGMMGVNEYKFDTLQSAKYSSMMMVYHLAKGWKKEGTNASFATAYRNRAAAAEQQSDEEMEDAEGEEDQDQFPTVQTRVGGAGGGTLSRHGSMDSLLSTRPIPFDSLSRQNSCGSLGGWAGPGASGEFGANSSHGRSIDNGRGPTGQSFDMLRSRHGSLGASFDCGSSQQGDSANTWLTGDAIEASFQKLVSNSHTAEMQQPFGLRHTTRDIGGRQDSFDLGRAITFDLDGSSKGSAPFEVQRGVSKDFTMERSISKEFDKDSVGGGGVSFELSGAASKATSFDMPSTPKTAGEAGFDLTYQLPAHQVRILDSSAGSFWDDFGVA